MIDVDELSEMFRSEAHERLNELYSALRAQQPELRDNSRFDDVRRAAHNLKGAALTVGAQPIAGLCRILETEVQAQIESGAPPTTEQIATWLYIVSEVQGIVDDPNIIHIQLVGFSDPPGVTDGEPCAVRASGRVPSSDPTVAPADNTAQELAAQLEQVREIQRNLTKRVEAIQARIDGCAFPEAGATPNNQWAIELRSELVDLLQDLQELAQAADQRAAQK